MSTEKERKKLGYNTSTEIELLNEWAIEWVSRVMESEFIRARVQPWYKRVYKRDLTDHLRTPNNRDVPRTIVAKELLAWLQNAPQDPITGIEVLGISQEELERCPERVQQQINALGMESLGDKPSDVLSILSDTVFNKMVSNGYATPQVAIYLQQLVKARILKIEGRSHWVTPIEMIQVCNLALNPLTGETGYFDRDLKEFVPGSYAEQTEAEGKYGNAIAVIRDYIELNEVDYDAIKKDIPWIEDILKGDVFPDIKQCLQLSIKVGVDTKELLEAYQQYGVDILMNDNQKNNSGGFVLLGR